MEVLVALAIFSILAAGVFYVATSSYRNFYGAGDRQQVVKFAQEGLEAVKSIRDNSWQEIEDVADSGNLGVAKNSSGYWEFSGSSDTLGSLTRIVAIDYVYRDESNNIVSEGGSLDLSTYKVTVTVSAFGISDYVLSAYLSNVVYKSWLQEDWSGNGYRDFWAEADMFSSTYSNVSTSTPSEISLSFTSGSYDYWRSITVDNTKVSGSGSHTDFPMLVSLTEDYLKSTANGGKVENADGYDIIFTSDDAGENQLSHEIEKYDPATGEFIAWVEIPTLSATADTVIYMFYSNSSISTSQEDIHNVWGTSHKFVSHMQNRDSVNLAPEDSTTYQNHLSKYGDAVQDSGKIGYGFHYDGTGDYTLGPHNEDLEITTAFSWSAWVKIDGGGHINGLFTKSGNSFRLMAGNTNPYYFRFQMYDLLGLNNFDRTYNSFFTEGEWTKVDFTFNKPDITLYKNGQSVSTWSWNNTLVNPATGYIIVGTIQTNMYYLDGLLDEIKLSNVDRGSDWIATSFNNENSTSTFYSISSEESTGGYSSPGSIYSSIFDLGSSDEELQTLYVSQDVPSGCSISIDLEAATSSDFSSPETVTFSDTASSYSTSTPASLNGYRYVRYKATLTACNSGSETPSLYSLKLDYR